VFVDLRGGTEKCDIKSRKKKKEGEGKERGKLHYTVQQERVVLYVKKSGVTIRGRSRSKF